MQKFKKNIIQRPKNKNQNQKPKKNNNKTKTNAAVLCCIIPESDSLLWDQHAIISGNLLGDISNQRDLELANTALVAGGARPRQM